MATRATIPLRTGREVSLASIERSSDLRAALVGASNLGRWPPMRLRRRMASFCRGRDGGNGEATTLDDREERAEIKRGRGKQRTGCRSTTQQHTRAYLSALCFHDLHHRRNASSIFQQRLQGHFRLTNGVGIGMRQCRQERGHLGCICRECHDVYLINAECTIKLYL